MDQDSFLLALLSHGFAQCHGVAIEHGNLLASLFLAGLLGSLTHCIGMCGPFVLAQTVSRLGARPARQMREFHRLTGAALLPYHLGRATTYSGLGAAAALLTAGAIELTGLRWLSAALLILAALFFLGLAGYRLLPRLPGGWVNRIASIPRSAAAVRLLAPLFARPVGWRGYALGISLGFLPCGLLWGALAAAAATGSPLAGALGMMAFSAGTVPALLAVGVAGHVAGHRFRTAALRLAPALMIINAATLSYLAWQTIT